MKQAAAATAAARGTLTTRPLGKAKQKTKRKDCKNIGGLATDDAGAQVSATDTQHHPKQKQRKQKKRKGCCYGRAADKHMQKCMPNLLKTGMHVLSKEEWKTRAGGLIKTEDDDVDLDAMAAWFVDLLAHSKPRAARRSGVESESPSEELD